MGIYRTSLICALLLIPMAAYAIGLQVIIDGRVVIFRDVPQSAWYATYVRQSAEAGIVNGYKDEYGNLKGLFGPGNRITLAEALKISVEGAGYDEELYGSMVPSDTDHWASAYVSVAKAENFELFAGSMPNLDQPAKRAEVASLFTSAFKADAGIEPLDTRYSDVDTRTDYAGSIEALSRAGVVSGDTDSEGQATGTFRPYDAINRAEVAKIVINARTEFGTPGAGREPPMASAQLVIYTGTEFSPRVLRIAKGERIEFRNESSGSMWIASDPHPIHTDLENFDSLESLSQGESYFYTFTRLGTWGYHNHVNPAHRGTIIVE